VGEAEAALNLAGQQLVIADNVPAAVAVLEGLDARLARLEQPQLLPLKQAVSADLAKLRQRPFTDTANAALRLSRLEAAVGALPLLADSSLRPPPARAPPRSSAALTRLTMIHAIGPMGVITAIRATHNSLGIRAGIDSSGVRAQSSRE